MFRKVMLILLISLYLYSAALSNENILDDKIDQTHDLSSGKTEGKVQLPNFRGIDIHGRAFSFAQLLKGKKGLVITVYDPTCPISKKLRPHLARLETSQLSSIAFLYLITNKSIDPKLIKESLARSNVGKTIYLDKKSILQKLIKPQTSTEVFLLNSSRKIVYRGAVTNEFTLLGRREYPTNYLSQTIDSLLENKKLPWNYTTAPGCSIAQRDLASGPPRRFFPKVASIINEKCVVCHHESGPAPFRLDRYEDIFSRRAMISYVVKQGIMPPWYVDKGFGPWENDLSLPAEQKSVLLSWAANPSDEEKAPKTFNEVGNRKNWQFGEPDTVLNIKGIKVPSDGELDYIYFTLPVNNSSVKYVQSYEFKIDSPQNVHHISTYLVEGAGAGRHRVGEAEKLVLGYVPSMNFMSFSEAKPRLPKDSHIMVEVHLSTTGIEKEIGLKIALNWSNSIPKYPLKKMYIEDRDINLPPRSKGRFGSAQKRLEGDILIYGLAPHMHYRGTGMEVREININQTAKVIFRASRYNFDWQRAYMFKNPILVKKGSTLDVQGWYDNTEANLSNPDPNKTIRYGPRTTDEMFFLVVHYAEVEAVSL